MTDNPQNLKIGAAYIRVSTDKQEEYSPASQLKLIRDYAQRSGYIIPDEFIYQDDGISGKTAQKRPAFRLMIAAAKENPAPFSAVFLWKFSRFARNQEEAILYKNLLKKRKIDVVSISEPSNDSPFSSLIERIIEWMDEYYLINLATEVRRGMKEKAARGEATGTAPIGYTVKDKHLVPDADAPLVQYIFEQFAAGKGARALASELGDKGVRTRRGNRPDNRWVHYILTNTAYIGKIRYSSEGHANYDRANFCGDNVIIVDDAHEPIISPELWEAVQQRIGARDTEVKYARKGNPMFMLKGLVRCGSCGATLTRVNTAAPSMQCNKYARGQCSTSHSITIARANEAVLSGLAELISSREFRFAPKKPPKQKSIYDWDKLIRSEENRLERAKNALLDGAFTTDEYKAIKAETENNIRKIEEAKAKEQPAANSDEPDKEAFAARVLKVLDVLRSPDISEEAKNTALRSIIDKIVYSKTDETFQFYFVSQL